MMCSDSQHILCQCNMQIKEEPEFDEKYVPIKEVAESDEKDVELT